MQLVHSLFVATEMRIDQWLHISLRQNVLSDEARGIVVAKGWDLRNLRG
jgi:hypothetical protein